MDEVYPGGCAVEDVHENVKCVITDESLGTVGDGGGEVCFLVIAITSTVVKWAAGPSKGLPAVPQADCTKLLQM